MTSNAPSGACVSVVAKTDAAQSTVPHNPYHERRWMDLSVVVTAQNHDSAECNCRVRGVAFGAGRPGLF
jgi:hypothetical protein